MVDCSKYLKKFYLGISVFFIILFIRIFEILPPKLPIILVAIPILIILIISLILVGPYLKCLEKNLKK